MFILVAMMCTTFEASSCTNYIWRERTFFTFEDCRDYAPKALLNNSDYNIVLPFCFNSRLGSGRWMQEGLL